MASPIEVRFRWDASREQTAARRGAAVSRKEEGEPGASLGKWLFGFSLALLVTFGGVGVYRLVNHLQAGKLDLDLLVDLAFFPGAPLGGVLLLLARYFFKGRAHRRRMRQAGFTGEWVSWSFAPEGIDYRVGEGRAERFSWDGLWGYGFADGLLLRPEETGVGYWLPAEALGEKGTWQPLVALVRGRASAWTALEEC
jgi:hypothetical protein